MTTAPGITEADVELAERYAAALETIERLQHVTKTVTEDAADLAATYAVDLHAISRLSGEWFDDDDAELAARYALDLRDISRLTCDGAFDAP